MDLIKHTKTLLEDIKSAVRASAEKKIFVYAEDGVSGTLGVKLSKPHTHLEYAKTAIEALQARAIRTGGRFGLSKYRFSLHDKKGSQGAERYLAFTVDRPVSIDEMIKDISILSNNVESGLKAIVSGGWNKTVSHVKGTQELHYHKSFVPDDLTHKLYYFVLSSHPAKCAHKISTNFKCKPRHDLKVDERIIDLFLAPVGLKEADILKTLGAIDSPSMN